MVYRIRTHEKLAEGASIVLKNGSAHSIDGFKAAYLEALCEEVGISGLGGQGRHPVLALWIGAR